MVLLPSVLSCRPLHQTQRTGCTGAGFGWIFGLDVKRVMVRIQGWADGSCFASPIVGDGLGL